MRNTHTYIRTHLNARCHCQQVVWQLLAIRQRKQLLLCVQRHQVAVHNRDVGMQAKSSQVRRRKLPSNAVCVDAAGCQQSDAGEAGVGLQQQALKACQPCL